MPREMCFLTLTKLQPQSIRSLNFGATSANAIYATLSSAQLSQVARETCREHRTVFLCGYIGDLTVDVGQKTHANSISSMHKCPRNSQYWEPDCLDQARLAENQKSDLIARAAI
eukprot:1966546-Amphidinium_carterae.1